MIANTPYRIVLKYFQVPTDMLPHSSRIIIIIDAKLLAPSTRHVMMSAVAAAQPFSRLAVPAIIYRHHATTTPCRNGYRKFKSKGSPLTVLQPCGDADSAPLCVFFGCHFSEFTLFLLWPCAYFETICNKELSM